MRNPELGGEIVQSAGVESEVTSEVVVNDVLSYHIDDQRRVMELYIADGCTLESTDERKVFLDGLRILAKDMKVTPALDETHIHFVSWDASHCDESVWKQQWGDDGEVKGVTFAREIGFSVGDFTMDEDDGHLEYEDTLAGLDRKNFLEKFGG